LPGHTPGHAVVEIASGADRVLFLADAILHELNFERPEWVSSGEIDADLTVETRKALLRGAVDESSLLLATHLARGGTVERGDGGFRFQPV
jgi:glyoxylase-like metal-dependent hydrolase (beta-lactamase superfamily II)